MGRGCGSQIQLQAQEGFAEPIVCFPPFFLKKTLTVYFIYLFVFLAALGLRCCARAFSSYSERGLLFVAVRGLLIAVPSLVAEHRL